MAESNALSEKIDEFTKNLGRIESSPIDAFSSTFHRDLNEINDLSLLVPEKRNEIMAEFFSRTAPIFDSSQVISRGRNKPLGYAGDYLTIDLIYAENCDSPGLGAKWDAFFHSCDAPRAVRNRKNYFVETVRNLVREKGQVSILNLASGPCRDVAEAIASLNGDSRQLEFYCVDIDSEAIKYATALLGSLDGQVKIIFERQNIFKFETSRKYDFVWSAGLFDYLDDEMAVKVIKRMWACTNTGGKLIVGNFHPSNTSRNFMEWCGQWFLIHRTDEELFDLFVKAGISESLVSIDREAIGACIFGTACKP